MTELERIEAALDKLVVAALPAPKKGYAEAMADMEERTTPPEPPTELDNWRELIFGEPVRTALTQGVRALGQRLHESGGSALMEDVCDRVSALDPDAQPERMAFIDYAWDGVGQWRC